MIDPTLIRSTEVGPCAAKVSTPVQARDVVEAMRAHDKVCKAQGGAPKPPCLETEIDCNGSNVTIETCCQVGESPEDCAQRHRDRIDAAKEACGS